MDDIRVGKIPLAEDFKKLEGGFAWRSYDKQLTDTTPWPDPDLTLPVRGNAFYEVRFEPLFQGSDAADIAFGFTFPAGALFWERTPGPAWNAFTGSDTTGPSQYYAVLESSSPTAPRDFGTNATFPLSGSMYGLLVTGSAAGSFQVTARQLADTSTTTFLRGSYLTIDRKK